MHEETRAVDTVCLEFQRKASGKIHHKRPVKKIPEAHGVTGKVLRWFTEWFSEGKHRVVTNGKTIKLAYSKQRCSPRSNNIRAQTLHNL